MGVWGCGGVTHLLEEHLSLFEDVLQFNKIQQVLLECLFVRVYLLQLHLQGLKLGLWGSEVTPALRRGGSYLKVNHLLRVRGLHVPSWAGLNPRLPQLCR